MPDADFHLGRSNRRARANLCGLRPEAPTVKGFVGILVELFNGSTAQEVMDTPDNLLKRLGLLEALGMVRMRGLSAIQHYIRQQVRKAAGM